MRILTGICIGISAKLYLEGCYFLASLPVGNTVYPDPLPVQDILFRNVACFYIGTLILTMGLLFLILRRLP